jgi:hypothetical protein
VAEGTHPTIGLSERGIKLTGDEQIAEQVRDALNSGYAKRTNETDKQFAQRLVLDAGGAQAAAQRWLNGDFDSRPSAVKTILGSEIQKQLATRERALRGQGKTAEADAIVSAQVQLAQHDIARATDLAQGLQAFNTHYMDWSPAAWLKHFRSSIGRLAAERVSVATGKETGTSGVEVSKAVTDAVAEELAPKQPKLARTLREQFGGEMDGKPLAERLERNGQAKPGKGKKLADELTKFYRNEVKKFRRRYNVPEFDAATEKDILQRANRINGLPEDSVQRREAALDLFRHMTRLKGFEWWELPLDFWYANILSGPTTHVKNILGNTVNVGAEAAVQMLRNPSAIPSILEAVGRSLPVAKREAVNIMRTGHDTAGRHGNKFEAPGVLENIENPIASKLLMPWKMVGRALKAEDVGFFYPLQEMKASVLASRQARAEGVPLYGGARAKRVRAILAWDAQAKAKAEIQAQREGLTGSLLERRVQELREQSRPPQLMESARDFAFLGTFNNDVYGILGTLTNAWSAAAQKVPGLKLVVPFTRIVANLSNSMLNWTPVGYYRGARAQGLKLLFGRPDNTGKLYGHAVTDPTAIGDLYTRSTLGTVALVAVAAGAAQYLFDANPNFMVTAQGPSDPDQRKLLQEAGWIPYSLKVGNRYYSYQDKPLAFGLSMVGHYLDAMRYRKLDQQDALNRVAYAFSAAGNVILNSSWLQGLSSIFNTANRDSTKSPLQAVPRQAIKTGSAFVVPNALKQLDQLFDDTKYSADDVREMMLREVPFARANNQLDLNVFGEPIHQPLSKIWMSKVEGDGLVQMLAGRRLWPSVPVDGGLSPAETYALMKYRGPMLRRELGQRLGDIATLPHAEARKLVEGISRQATDRAKKDLGLDDVSRLKRDQLKRSER